MSTMFFGYYFGKLSVAVTDKVKPEKGDWQELDVNTLSESQRGLYNDYKDCYRDMKEAKNAFEAVMRREAGIRALPEKAKTTPKKGLSLADFMAQQKANGGSL
jgi:hypothetical protein